MTRRRLAGGVFIVGGVFMLSVGLLPTAIAARVLLGFFLLIFLGIPLFEVVNGPLLCGKDCTVHQHRWI